MLYLIGIVFLLLIYLFYKWATKDHNYFLKAGIPHKKPYFLLGNTGAFFFKKVSIAESFLWLYNLFPNEKFIGMFDLMTPSFFIRDPELIKQLAIKDFDYFVDHRQFLDRNTEPVLGNALSVLAGQKWKDMRATLSPAFTGSKMRQMFVLVNDCSEQMSKYFLKETEANTRQILDMKDIFSRFTTDVIATCAFGIKVNSLENRKNEFFVMGKQILDTSKWTAVLKFLIIVNAPRLAKLLKIQLVDESINNFFRSLILSTMVVREKENIVRPDMINLLMQVKKGNLVHDKEKTIDGFAAVDESNIEDKNTRKTQWTDDELVAQCLVFFIAGFDTSSTLLAFTAFELALNPEVQSKLIQEIDEMNYDINEKKLSYEKLQTMKYMDMVISETLRKWPPAIATDRVCVKDYTFNVNDETKYTIEKGKYIFIPIYCLHHSAEYFPNPELFDPERFSSENLSNIVPGSYLPFGIGPRNCIGSRFALMEVKGIIFHLLSHFTFEICEKTILPIQMGTLSIVPKTGIHLELKRRR